MKIFVPILVLLGSVPVFSAPSMTQTIESTAPGAARFAQLLKGHSLRCIATEGSASLSPDSLLPLTVSAKELGQGKTAVSVTKTGSDYFGDDLRAEASDRWLILTGQGADDARYLMIRLYEPSDFAAGDVPYTSGLYSFQRDDGTMTSVLPLRCDLR